jgi:transcriptional regulator with XRE-family HTH domain
MSPYANNPNNPNASPLSSAQAARKLIADRLGEIRRDAGLTGRELAARCGWSESKTSRIEGGKTVPSDADIRDWCRACQAEARADDLVAANRSADSMYVQWRRRHRTGMRRVQEDLLTQYDSTKAFHIYCSNVVPGILQTPPYAEALITMITDFQNTPRDVTEAVASRVERARSLYRADHSFAILLEETVLKYRLGDAGVMAGQLGHLLEIMSLPAVSLGIIPADAQRARLAPGSVLHVRQQTGDGGDAHRRDQRNRPQRGPRLRPRLRRPGPQRRPRSSRPRARSRRHQRPELTPLAPAPAAPRRPSEP